MLITFQILILTCLICLLLNLVYNLKTMEKPANFKIEDKDYPLISVLVPARNEERKIKDCILSLLKQDYPNLEIIVLDDNSKDRTYEIVKEISKANKKLKVLKGKVLPEHWTGKNWACYQLFQASKGEWLAFTDADTIHKPNSISSAHRVAIKNDSQFVTYIPGLITKKLSEGLILPIMHFSFLCLFPLGLINRLKDPRISLGIGPFMFFRKDFYYKIGGHKYIKNEIVDDIILARNVKKSMGKISIVDGSDTLEVRFYRGFKEIWKGFSKNAYGVFENSPFIVLITITVNYFLFIYPYFLFIKSLNTKNFISISAFQVTIISAMKILLAIRFNTSIFLGLLHPLSCIIFLLILINSFRLWVVEKGVEWKDRYYPIE